MFRKKTKPEPEPFVPHHYVSVRYAGDLAFRSKYYETRGEAEQSNQVVYKPGATTINLGPR